MEDNRIHLRPSMRKFESNHRRLEVLQTSRPQAVYLNHQLIMLLSNLGVPDDVFIGHQQKMLDGLACELVSEIYLRTTPRMLEFAYTCIYISLMSFLLKDSNALFPTPLYSKHEIHVCLHFT